MSKKRILIIGGGFAGVKLALELGKNNYYKVQLIAPHDQLEYHGALYRSATGRSPLEVVIPFREVFQHTPHVDIINDQLVELRAASKEIKGQSGEIYGYDALVLGIGYEKEYFNTRGAEAHTESIYTMHDAIQLRSKLRDVFVDNQGKHCDVVIVGAGPTGLETAGDIKTFATIVAAQFGTKPARPKITVVDRADRVLPMMSEEVSRLAKQRLTELGIAFVHGVAVDHCTSSHICVSGGKTLQADVMIWTAGNKANSLFERYPDIFSLDARKRVMVGEYMQANNPNIYVIGDAASTPYTGMAQTAISDAEQLAANFNRYAQGEDLVAYKPKKPLYVVPIGHDWAVAQKGTHVLTGDAGWKLRRDADLAVLQSFLSEDLAKEHWEKGLQIARLTEE